MKSVEIHIKLFLIFLKYLNDDVSCWNVLIFLCFVFVSETVYKEEKEKLHHLTKRMSRRRERADKQGLDYSSDESTPTHGQLSVLAEELSYSDGDITTEQLEDDNITDLHNSQSGSDSVYKIQCEVLSSVKTDCNSSENRECSDVDDEKLLNDNNKTDLLKCQFGDINANFHSQEIPSSDSDAIKTDLLTCQFGDINGNFHSPEEIPSSDSHVIKPVDENNEIEVLKYLSEETDVNKNHSDVLHSTETNFQTSEEISYSDSCVNKPLDGNDNLPKRQSGEICVGENQCKILITSVTGHQSPENADKASQGIAIPNCADKGVGTSNPFDYNRRESSSLGMQTEQDNKEIAVQTDSDSVIDMNDAILRNTPYCAKMNERAIPDNITLNDQSTDSSLDTSMEASLTTSTIKSVEGCTLDVASVNTEGIENHKKLFKNVLNNITDFQLSTLISVPQNDGKKTDINKIEDLSSDSNFNNEEVEKENITASLIDTKYLTSMSLPISDIDCPSIDSNEHLIINSVSDGEDCIDGPPGKCDNELTCYGQIESIVNPCYSSVLQTENDIIPGGEQLKNKDVDDTKRTDFDKYSSVNDLVLVDCEQEGTDTEVEMKEARIVVTPKTNENNFQAYCQSLEWSERRGSRKGSGDGQAQETYRQCESQNSSRFSLSSLDSEAERLYWTDTKHTQRSLRKVKNKYELLLKQFELMTSETPVDENEMSSSKSCYDLVMRFKDELEQELEKAREQLELVVAANDKDNKTDNMFLLKENEEISTVLKLPEQLLPLDYKNNDKEDNRYVDQSSNREKSVHNITEKKSQLVNNLELSTKRTGVNLVEDMKPEHLKWITETLSMSEEKAKRNEKITLAAIENTEIKKELLLTKLEKIRLEAVLSCVMMTSDSNDMTKEFQQLAVNSMRNLTTSRSTLSSSTSCAQLSVNTTPDSTYQVLLFVSCVL